MALKRITIDSVINGQSRIWHSGAKGQFLRSIAIDTERTSSTIIKPGQNITPVRYQKKSGSNVTGTPMWIMSNGKNQKTYIYCSDGKLISYDNVYAETSIGTPTSGAGNGMTYYNDYLYLATPTDISRYGPLSGSASLANTYWSSTLSKTALNNTTYPATRGVNYPNHVLFVHPSDNRLYIADYKNGQGQIHYLTTAYDGSAGAGVYQALMLPFGFMPMAMAVSGTDLAILCTPEGGWVGGSIFKPGRAALFIWDRSSVSFYRQIPLRATMATALLNKEGVLYYWTGNLDTEVTLSKYLGGYSSQALADITQGSPPFAGAVDIVGDQIVWGGWNTSPQVVAGIYSYGSRTPGLTTDVLNHIGRISDPGKTLPIVSSLASLVPGPLEDSILMGWRTNSAAAFGVDCAGGPGAYNSLFSTLVYNVGQNFDIKRIKIPLGVPIVANMTITPTVYFDDYNSSQVLRTINSTNFKNGELFIEIPITEHLGGQHNFLIEFAWTGTAELPINLPITIDIETYND